MTFLLPTPLPDSAVATLKDACIASSTMGYFDQTPLPTDTYVQDGKLILNRTQNESGYLVLAWPIQPYGMVMATTTTLRERPEPYRLLVELARGKLNQVRGQLAEWRDTGLVTTPEFDRGLAETTRLFGRAALAANQGESDGSAAQVLESAYALADQLAHQYVEHTLAERRQREGSLSTLLSARFQKPITNGGWETYQATFNAASICFRWCDIEPVQAQYDWTETDTAVAIAKSAGMPVTLGPVIDLSSGMLPKWTTAWEADLPALAACMCDYLETALHRYKNDVRRWIICAGFNHTDALGLVDDDRLRLAYRLFEAAAQVDSSLELVLSISQPWGDYLTSEEQTISPLAFPDDLIRAGVRLAALEIEIRVGTRPRGSLPRDLLEIARLFDSFGKLGTPLEVLLSMPSTDAADHNSNPQLERCDKQGRLTLFSSDVQARWGEAVAALALSWSSVHRVTWENWTDAEPHISPNSGLLTATGDPKPLLAKLRMLKQQHLQSAE